MNRLFPSLLLAAAPLVWLGCGAQSISPEQPNCESGSDICEQDEEEKEPGRIYVDPPFGVGFECVEVGCEETRAFRVENRGGAPIKLELIRLSVESSADLSISLAREGASTPAFPSVDEPLTLRPEQAFDIVVTYSQSDDVSDEGAVWVDWYDASVPYEEAVVERVELPITTRVLGDAVAQLVTEELNFGFVPLGEKKTMAVQVFNATDGTAVLKVEAPTLDPGTPANFYLEGDPEERIYVNPGQTAEVQVTFEPGEQDWYAGLLYLATNDGAQPQLAVELLGTAIREPYFEVVEPDDWTVDFGELRVGNSGERTVRLRNLGGQPLSVTASMPEGAALGFATSAPTDGSALPSLPPLGEATFTVTATPNVGGDLVGEMQFSTNDPTLAEDFLDLKVFGVAPEPAVTPGADLDLGDVVQGWQSLPESLFISNSGTGDLTINAVRWELGSSSQLVVIAPNLPIKIRPEEDPVEISVYVNAQTLGPVAGTLIIETDGIENPTVSVSVTAQVVSCEQGCGIENGIPTCNAGQCEIDSCLSGYHDADQRPETGCECGEDTTPFGTQEIGDFCSSGAQLGTLNDDGGTEQVTRTGTLHSADDVDLYYFRGNDTSEFLDDDYRVKVELTSAPTGLEFCIRIVDSGGGCGGENQWSCGHRSYRGPGNGIGDDSEDVTVWVRWGNQAEAMCGNYTIRLRANDG